MPRPTGRHHIRNYANHIAVAVSENYLLSSGVNYDFIEQMPEKTYILDIPKEEKDTEKKSKLNIE